MDKNTVIGSLAFGNNGGYFWSEHAEGEISIHNGNIASVLRAPYNAGDYSLGRRMKDYQHALFELEKGSKISEGDLELLCSMIGTKVIKEGKLSHCNIELKPFEIRLIVNLTNLTNNETAKVEQLYKAENVKAGIFGLGSEFGIRYNLTPKE